MSEARIKDGGRYQLTVSLRCNNHCVFCMEGDHAGADLERNRSARGRDYLGVEALEKTLEAMTDTYTPVIFTSGEPTLNPELIALVEAVSRKGFKRIAIQTNGKKLAYRAYLLELIRAGVREFAISVHGGRASVHDGQTRSVGSFTQTMTGLRNVLEAKRRWPALRVSTHTTVTRINMDDMESLLRRLLAQRGIDTIVLNPVVPEGGARRRLQLLLPRYSDMLGQFRRAWDMLSRENVFGLRKVTWVDLPPCLTTGLGSVVGSLETALLVGPGGGVEKQGLKQDFPGAWGPDCSACVRKDRCSGVHPAYAERFGWEEFQPWRS